MTAGPSEALGSRLGYLLKHAQQRLVRAAGPVMAQFGIDGRQLAVLTVLAADYPLSQHEAAERLGVDRTTMVALVDDLEGKGLVERHRSLQDRRKNIVQLTKPGRERLHTAEQLRQEAESRFLAPLTEAEAAQFVRALRLLTASD